MPLELCSVPFCSVTLSVSPTADGSLPPSYQPTDLTIHPISKYRDLWACPCASRNTMAISSYPTLNEEADLPWPDSRSMSSDDLHQEMPFGGSSVPHAPTRKGSNANANPLSQMPTGQLSPISNNMETQGLEVSIGGCPPPLPSRTDSWSTENTDDLEEDDPPSQLQWEQGSDDMLAVPKLEPLDDDFNLDELREAPTVADEDGDLSPTQPKPKRPRGRPRKHPLTTAINTSKITKGRSKTGCITCRKRKKKCDEAKPRCKNPSSFLL